MFPDLSSEPDLSSRVLTRIESGDKRVAISDPVTSRNITIKDSKSRLLFNRADLNQVSDLSFLRSKARIYEDQNALVKEVFSDAGDVGLSGVYYVQGDFVLDQPLKIRAGGGGMIIAENNLVINQSIQVAAKETLTLVSLNGDIKVRGGLRVEAGLVALNGTTSIPSDIDLEGFLATEQLDLKAGASHKSEIQWNPDFDATNHETQQRSFKVWFNGKWKSFISGS